MNKHRLAFSLLLACMLLFAGFAPVGAEPSDNAKQWLFSHSLEFPPGFWEPGAHSYDFHLRADGVDYTFHVEFEVTDDAPLYKGQVQLRFGGLSTPEGGVTEINPAQDTVMQLTWLAGTDRQAAKAFRETSNLEISWDGGDWVDVPAGPLTKASAFFNPGKFKRSWGGLKVH